MRKQLSNNRGQNRGIRTGVHRAARGWGDPTFYTNIGDVLLGTTRLLPGRQLFPPRRTAVLRYAETGSITTPASTNAATVLFALNGLSAINVTNSTGTPYEWSKVTALWNQYLVLRCRGVITLWNPPNADCTYGVQLRGPNPAGSAFGAIASRPGSQFGTFGANGEGRLSIPFDVQIPDAFGRDLATYRADYGSVVSANPGTGSPDLTCLLSLWMINALGSAVACNYNAKFEFNVELFDQVL